MKTIIEMQRETILEMMKDFLKYGYSFKSFLEFKYPICENFNEDTLRGMWDKAIEIMSSF